MLSPTADTKLNPLVKCARFLPSGCWQLSSLCSTHNPVPLMGNWHWDNYAANTWWITPSSDILCARWKPGYFILLRLHLSAQPCKKVTDSENTHNSFSVLFLPRNYVTLVISIQRMWLSPSACSGPGILSLDSTSLLGAPTAKQTNSAGSDQYEAHRGHGKGTHPVWRRGLQGLPRGDLEAKAQKDN